MPGPRCAASAGSSIAAWVPRATSTVRRVTRPCSAPSTAESSSGSGQLRVPSGTITQTLRPSSGTPSSCSRTNAWICAFSSTTPGPPIRARSHRVVMAGGSSTAWWTLHSTGMALALHPDRLLPAEPGVRAIARELYGAVRELPVISPHGHVDPRAAARRRAIRRPGIPAGDAGPLRDAAAACVGRGARRARRRAGAVVGGGGARRVAAAVRTLARLSRHAGPLLARASAGGDLRHRAPAVGGVGRRALRRADRAARRARLPAASAVRPVPDRGPGHDRRSVRRPRRPRGTRCRPVLVRPGDPDLPA